MREQRHGIRHPTQPAGETAFVRGSAWARWPDVAQSAVGAFLVDDAEITPPGAF